MQTSQQQNTLNTPFVVKVVFENDIRRFVLAEKTYDSLASSVMRAFSLTSRDYVIRYTDEDGDTLTISSDPELEEAFRVSENSKTLLRLFVSMADDEDSNFTVIAPRNKSAATTPVVPSPVTTNPIPVEEIVSSEALKSTTQEGQPTTKEGQPTTQEEQPTTQEEQPTTKEGQPTTQEEQPTTQVPSALPVAVPVLYSRPEAILQVLPAPAATPVEASVSPAPSKVVVMATNQLKCQRPTCAFVAHPNVKNNGGTHCCAACKTKAAKHGPACKRTIIGTPPKDSAIPIFPTKPKLPAESTVTPHSPDVVVSAPLVEQVFICDGCDSTIQGIRFHCYICPDFDLCEGCEADPLQTKAAEHSLGHPLLKVPVKPQEEKQAKPEVVVHQGITCDGCNMENIEGDRFKCMICHDYDLCSSCESTPGKHPADHTLLKMRVPTRVWKTAHRQAVKQKRENKQRCREEAKARKQAEKKEKKAEPVVQGSASSSSSESEGKEEGKEEADADAALVKLLGDEPIPVEWRKEWKVQRKMQRKLAKKICKAERKEIKAELKKKKQEHKQACQDWKAQTAEWRARAREWRAAAKGRIWGSGSQPEAPLPAAIAPSAPAAPEVEPFGAKDLTSLEAMGFDNEILNRALLTKFQGNMEKVISALVELEKL